VRELERLLDRQERLAQASYALHTTLDLDELLRIILKTASEGVDADRGTVYLVREGGTELWSRVLSGDRTLEITLPIGQGIAGAVAETGEPLRIPDAYADPRFDSSWDEKSGYRTRQILCAPIRSREGRIVGVFQLLNKNAGEFSVEDEDYLAALSIHAALAVENARLHKSALEKERYDREVSLAQGVQRRIQPERRSTSAGVIAAAGLNEMCEDATGDYYDFLLEELPGDRIGVVIGDVAGHGLQAALVMAETRAYLRAFVRTAESLPEALDLLNDFLVPDMIRGKFISLFAALIDTRTGRVEWCNAGHNPPLLCRAGGELSELEATGRVLGVLRDAAYRAGDAIELQKGDVLLLYTDGITEAMGADREQFGAERLAELLRGASGRGPEEIVGDLRAAVLDWTGSDSNQDDLTLVVVRRER
jgi:sigma-B regulation protein RsbU (phosphoserine phosphatase)